MTAAGRVPGSFRDPSGSVFQAGGRIFRGIAETAAPDATAFLASAVYQRHAGKGIVRTHALPAADVIAAGLAAEDAARFPLWLEHERIDFLTFPYEWSFELLRSAALLQLDLHLDALASGWDIVDASAYNIQFRGARPVFIDTLSFRPYQPGGYWLGYKQFCEQYLAPLALNAYAKVDYQPWFRGALDGIDIVSASRLLPARSYASFTLLANIHAQAWAMQRVSAARDAQAVRKPQGLPLARYVALLQSLRRFIAGLRPHTATYWAGYRNDSSYSDAGAREKAALVQAFLQRQPVRRLVDLGCNTGHYSELAIAAGVQQVVGTDYDAGALDVAVRHAAAKGLAITPIQLDICNPSPALGWNLAERPSLQQRLQGADATLSLAVIHHIVIARNIPLDDYVDWLTAIAPRGLVEFVPKEDSMVAGLLAHREDIFPGYTQANFLQSLARHVRVTDVFPIAQSQRVLVAFEPR